MEETTAEKQPTEADITSMFIDLNMIVRSSDNSPAYRKHAVTGSSTSTESPPPPPPSPVHGASVNGTFVTSKFTFPPIRHRPCRHVPLPPRDHPIAHQQLQRSVPHLLVPLHLHLPHSRGHLLCGADHCMCSLVCPVLIQHQNTTMCWPEPELIRSLDIVLGQTCAG